MILQALLFHPIAQYVAATALFGLCLSRLLKLSREIESLSTTVRDMGESAKSELAAHRTDISRLEVLVRDLEEQSRLNAGASAKSLVNINKRTQALRMLRGGEAPNRVANALGMSRGEVDLLVKVQGIVLNSYESTPTLDSDEQNSRIFLNA
jgi:hypothetical protein